MTTHALPAGHLKLERRAHSLVDRLLPRGLTKAEVAVDRWVKELGPNTGLHHCHDLGCSEFHRRYTLELKQHEATLDEIRELARQGALTLLFGRATANTMTLLCRGMPCSERDSSLWEACVRRISAEGSHGTACA